MTENNMTSHRPKPLKSDKTYDRLRDKRLYEEELNEIDQESKDVFQDSESARRNE